MPVFNFMDKRKKNKFLFAICLLLILIGGLNLVNSQSAFAQTQTAAPKRTSPNHTATISYSVEYQVGFEKCSEGGQPLRTKLYVSYDGGITRQEQGQEFNGRILMAGSAHNDPRVAYLVVSDKPVVRTSQPALFFYISWDAGQTWEKRGELNLPKVFATLTSADFDSSCWLSGGSVKGLPGPAAPVTAAEVSLWAGRGLRSVPIYQVGVTVDGGQTFWYKEPRSDYHYTPDGLIRYKYSENEPPTLELLNSATKTWQKRSLPDYNLPDYQGFGPVIKQPCVTPYPLCVVNYLEQPENVSGHLFLTSRGFSGYSPELSAALSVWYSPDSGKSWRRLATSVQGVTFSETLPLEVTVFKDGKASVLDIPDLNSTQTLAVQPKNAPTSIYFSETGHNLYGKFKSYWENNGGLELFGYPLTEQFYEKNPDNGNFYVVQYFERNRFEWHPELAGTKHEVLLGLLGQQLTAKQRDQRNGAFNYFPDLKYSQSIYFPQTGHNLRNAFKTHWETNGGLAVFGYPISEEFEEINPDDNKTYIVQYFERNRFEWHPEHEGTKYVVQLGLLGKTLLEEKGWLSFK